MLDNDLAELYGWIKKKRINQGRKLDVRFPEN